MEIREKEGTSFGPYQPVTPQNAFESKTLNKSLKKGGRRNAVPGIRPKGSGDIVTSVSDLQLGCWELRRILLITSQVLLLSCL